MGFKKQIKLNPFKFNNLKLINNNNLSDENILGMTNFISNKKIIIFSNDILFINFFLNVVKKKITLFVSKPLNFDTKIKYNLVENKKTFNKYIDNNTLIIDDLGLVRLLPNKKNLSIFTKKNILNKNYQTYKYSKGRLFQKNSKNICTDYLFYSKEKILKRIVKNKISGFSSIKSLELFPFDLCYESLLPHVDEFILGIDNSQFNKKRKKILENFLKKTKYRKKIKLKFLNFNTEIFNNFKSQGRWISNINNFLLNFCSGEYCFYIQSDEFLEDINLRKKLNQFIKEKYDQIYFSFVHYIFTLKTIRDPRKASYINAIRYFKNQNSYSSYDGYNFSKNENILFPKIKFSKIKVLHLSYIFNVSNKIKSNFSKKEGLFYNLSTKRRWLQNIFAIKGIDLTEKINDYKYLHNSKKIIKASQNNENTIKL
tara:strand:+ start:305 stop:1585 length:1281 start_codon:yes stop_codon:yes gene_type:complete